MNPLGLSTWFLILQFGSLLLPGGTAQDVPTCNSCRIQISQNTITWDPFADVPAAETESFSSSIAAAQGTAPFTIKYVDAIPTSVLSLPDGSQTTVTCCDPYTSVEWDLFEIYYNPTTTLDNGAKDGVVVTSCVSTGHLPFTVEAFIITQSGQQEPAFPSSLSCLIAATSGLTFGTTKTFIGRLLQPQTQTPVVTEAAVPSEMAAPAGTDTPVPTTAQQSVEVPASTNEPASASMFFQPSVPVQTLSQVVVPTATESAVKVTPPLVITETSVAGSITATAAGPTTIPFSNSATSRRCLMNTMGVFCLPAVAAILLL